MENQGEATVATGILLFECSFKMQFLHSSSKLHLQPDQKAKHNRLQKIRKLSKKNQWLDIKMPKTQL